MPINGGVLLLLLMLLLFQAFSVNGAALLRLLILGRLG